MRFVDVSPGGGSGGGGGGGGNPDPGTIIMPGNPLDPSEPGIGAVEPGLGDPNGNPVVVTQPVRPKLTAPERIEKEIKDTGLDECSAGVLNDLKELAEKDVAKIIAKLDAFPSQYTTNIKTEAFVPNDGSSLARTTRTIGADGNPMRFNYTIRIDPTYAATANKLSLASTIIHELLHAYMFSLVDDQATGINPNAFEEFPLLYETYVAKTFGPNPSVAHHTIMSEKYVDVVARALQEYQTGVPVPEGIHPQQIYKDLAWGGLRDTPAYNALSPEEQDRINNRYAAESKNTTFDIQEPIGNPCN
ncbi:hypothetical protein OGH69_05000 [Flavobacterium sp. MFBS3-15]|uniref:hypothetical protein n=1 Tax=Flavobacterium sp. MFBS3-15 TaxID=2989816 RepID=UPI0022363EEC|nr:hypothetical protein [Flavobacterium sp. MFBS3-15]MCW4468316.1 hypothetical protein [Flavobacterium sp. MFBS3-15]